MDMVRMFAPKRLEDRRGRDLLPALSLASLLALVAGGALAQTSIVTPRLDTSLTWTDNAGSSGSGGFGGGAVGDGGSDWILEVSPGVSVYRDSGRLSGNLSANFRNLMYASNTDNNTTYLSLNGSGQFEAVEDMLFIDADAWISRNNQSAFSTRPTGDSLDVDASNQMRVFTLSPRFQFRIGDNTEGALRYERRWSNAGSSQLADQDKDQWSADITNTRITGIFGLGLAYNRQSGGTSGGSSGSSRQGSQDQEIARATLYAKVTPEFRLRGIVGHEKNDYGTSGTESNTITGAGFDWNPGERTAVAATVEKRVFGNGYDLSVQHRVARTTVFGSFSRDIESSLDLIAGGGFNDPFYQSIYEGIVRDNPGISPTLASDLALLFVRQLRGDVLTNAYFVSRSMSAGINHELRRGIVSLTFNRSDRSRLGNATDLSAEDDFRNFDDIATDSVTLSYSHRLTPRASLNASVMRSTSDGRGAESSDTERSAFQVGLSSSLGPKTTGALIYRHQRTDGNGYKADESERKENSVSATLGMSF